MGGGEYFYHFYSVTMGKKTIGEGAPGIYGNGISDDLFSFKG